MIVQDVDETDRGRDEERDAAADRVERPASHPVFEEPEEADGLERPGEPGAREIPEEPRGPEEPEDPGERSRPRRRLGWRVARRLVRLAAALALVGAVSIVLFRWVPPPTSTMILRHRWIAGGSGAGAPERTWVPWEEISPHLALAVVAAEDQRFPEHWGLDTEAIAEAWEEGQEGERRRGASTITQQVAKNLFLWPGRSYLRKGLEAGIAVTLEGVWPKRRILEVYLNFAQMGESTYGAEAASRRYFGKPAADLSREEAALLAAVLPNPVRFRADRPSPYVLRRRAWILRQMRQLGGLEVLGLEPEPRGR